MANPHCVFKDLRRALWCLGGRPVFPGVGGHLLISHEDTVDVSGPSWGPSHKAQGILGRAALDFPLLRAAHPPQVPGHWGTKGRTPSTPFMVHRGQESDPWKHENFSFTSQDFLGGKSSGPRGGSGRTTGQAGDSVI